MSILVDWHREKMWQRVSRSLDFPVTIRYQSQETSMTCTMLSQSYIETAYGIPASGGEKRYYMNEAKTGRNSDKFSRAQCVI